MTGYQCQVVADSINPAGNRLTTMVVTFPRFILAEFNTHRMLSRNSASSRAIPPEKHIERVKENPFIPVFGTRVKGMGSGELNTEQAMAEHTWLSARNHAVIAAQRLIDLGVDKARINRLLEPFMWHTVIVSATEWDNFFALRCHPDAQPEFRQAAELMRDCLELSSPVYKEWGEWHLPLFGQHADDSNFTGGYAARVSAGRCARVSFDKHYEEEDPNRSIERWVMLSHSGHWSPGEHPAQAEETTWDGTTPVSDHGNFRGWQQLRKQYLNEAVFQG